LTIEIGFALANESCRERPIFGSRFEPLIKADVLESSIP
jgi:hypothetical protein